MKHSVKAVRFSSGEWTANLFEFDQRDKDGLVHRNIDLVDRMASHQELESEAFARDCALIVLGDEYWIDCGKATPPGSGEGAQKRLLKKVLKRVSAVA